MTGSAIVAALAAWVAASISLSLLVAGFIGFGTHSGPGGTPVRRMRPAEREA